MSTTMFEQHETSTNVGLTDRDYIESTNSQLPREASTDDYSHDDDVSDLSDHDSYGNDCHHDFDPSSSSIPHHHHHQGGYRNSIASRKSYHSSMMPEGLQTPPMALKQLLILKKTTSIQSLTAGTQQDGMPRLPSRIKICTSSSTPVLSRCQQQKRGSMNNASWDEPPEPCDSTGLSSNPLMHRFHPSLSVGENLSTNLRGQESLRSKNVNRSSVSRDHPTEIIRGPPSRTNLRNCARAVFGSQQAYNTGAHHGNATWSNIMANVTLEANGSSAAQKHNNNNNTNNMFWGGINSQTPVVIPPKRQEPRLSDVSRRTCGSIMSDSAPCMPHRRASNGGAAGQFQGGTMH